MDLGMQMKSVELMTKFMTLDLRGVNKIPYTVQKQPTPKAVHPAPLPRCAPEAQGVHSAALERLLKGMDDGEEINPHSVMVLRRGKVILEAHWKPYSGSRVHMLYSMSKSITATAIGIAVDEGRFSLDEKLIDIFRDKVPPAQGLLLRKVTVRHLLTMSTGIRFNEVGSILYEDWERAYLESLPKFEPGSAFEYNSMNSYMLAAVLRRKTGMGVAEFLEPRLFRPLGIEEYTWETCPRGIEKGGWGLNLRVEDAAKVGELYRRGGTWVVDGREKRILSQEWIEAATSVQIPTPNGECKDGYGYQIWMNPIQGGYQFNGAFGQYVVVLPRYETVIAIMSGSTRLFAQGSLMEGIQALCQEGMQEQPLPDNPMAYEKLCAFAENLRINAADALDGADDDAQTFWNIADALNGREYFPGENIGSAFPLILQGVHSNFTAGISLIRFARTQGGLDLCLYEQAECNHIPLCPADGFTDCAITLRGETQPASVRTQWRKDADGAMVLRVSITYVETPDTRVLTLFFTKDKLRIVFAECPSVKAASQMLFELVGMDKLETSLLNKLSDIRQAQLDGRLRPLTDPEVMAGVIEHHGAALAITEERR